MSGRYTITIKYGGDEIPYSPFRIHALPTGDASKCLVTGGYPYPVLSQVGAVTQPLSWPYMLLSLQCQSVAMAWVSPLALLSLWGSGDCWEGMGLVHYSLPTTLLMGASSMLQGPAWVPASRLGRRR